MASGAYSQLVRELVLANHILALENVLDAYGHVSVRDPARPGTFLMSRSRSPEIVTEADIFAHDFAGAVDGIPEPELYRERFIHGAIYDARPDVNAVIHSHADDVLPFSISAIPFHAVTHGASALGSEPAPVWDIRKEFGDTNMLVQSIAQGQSLSRKLDGHAVVLMRGHGFSAAGDSLVRVVKLATSLPRNARAILDVLHAGGSVTGLSAGEVSERDKMDFNSPALQRQWEYWARKLGVAYEPATF
jgi:ribulose-5-phosphate 4-epimerase/fuculose-1-phosphate aldolase